MRSYGIALALPAALLVFCSACSAAAPGSPVAAADEVQAAADVDVIHCVEAFIDHGAAITFVAEPGSSELRKAVYTETTFRSTEVVTEMNVCTKAPVPGVAAPDLAVKTYSCNDVSFVDGWKVDLFESLVSGQPTITLFHMEGTSGQLAPVDKSFHCTYVTPPPPDVCPTAEIAFSQAQGCRNDGSVEFCVPKADVALQRRVRGIAPSVRFTGNGGHARCDRQTEYLAMWPTGDAECSGDALTAQAWSAVCSIASEPAVRRVVATFFE